MHTWNKEACDRKGSINVCLGYLASMMLTGVPPVVCESVLNELLVSFKKTTGQLFSAK
jgi:hypothetical protein